MENKTRAKTFVEEVSTFPGGEGHRSREIANILDINVKTVLNHRTSLMRKLDIHKQTELVKYAIRRGLINPENQVRM